LKDIQFQVVLAKGDVSMELSSWIGLLGQTGRRCGATHLSRGKITEVACESCQGSRLGLQLNFKRVNCSNTERSS